MTDFLLSKRAQQPQAPSYTPTPNIVIEPIDPLVQQAVNKIKQNNPNFFMQVEKIVVHFGGGAGNLGYVKRGPNDNPRIIHIYKDRIKEIIQKQLGGNMNASSFDQAVQLAIAEVIGHERAHIGEKPEEFFHGESEAERGGAEIAQKLKPQFSDDLLNAALALDDIRGKYLPSMAMTEPNLSFTIYCKFNNKYNMIKEGLRLLCDPKVCPAVGELQDACEFNYGRMRVAAKNFGSIEKIAGLSFGNTDFALKLAEFQYEMGLKPTGKIDLQTLRKFADVKFREFPRNFGVVIPDKLYRGGLIEHPFQARALRDQCGVKRIVSLHEDPEIARICSFLGIEHVPAYLKWGESHEQGRKIFGSSVSSFLMEKPTYVHCFYGEDRTGGVIARFRTESGWPCKLAYLEAKAYGFKDIFTPLIEWFVEPTGESPPINLDKMKIKFMELMVDDSKNHLYDKTSGKTTYVTDSQIHGKGLFAGKYFDKGDFIEVALEKINDSGDLDKDWQRTQAGRFINHSDNPNAILKRDNNRLILKALNFIPENEEITSNYKDFEKEIQQNVEQNLIEPTPNDMPFSTPFEVVNEGNYTTWADSVNNITPMSITSPLSSGSQGV